MLRSPITVDNVDRARPGMAMREVGAILGGPGEQAGEGWQLATLAMPLLKQDFVAEALRWDHGGRQAMVFLGGDGVVLGAIYIDRRQGWLPWEVRRLPGLGRGATPLGAGHAFDTRHRSG